MLGANSMLAGNGNNGGGGGGDIWSTGAFSFESPLKDLLDSGDYSLEQLLAEDELLQELRSYHEQLTQYFAKPESVTKLVEYVIMMMPTQEGNLAATAATKTTITTANSSSSSAAAATSSNNTRPTTTTTMEGVEVEKEQQDDGTTTTALAIKNHNNDDDDVDDDDNEDHPNHTASASPVAADTAGGGDSTTTTEDTESEVVEAAAIATESTTTTTTTTTPHRVLLQRQQRHLEDDNNTKESAIANKNNQEESSEQQQQQQNPDKIVVDPASLKHVRFPYMACEIICCEIPEILQTLVEGKVSRKQRRTSTQQSQQQPQEAPASDEGPVVMVVSDDDDDEQDEEEEISILDLLFSLLYDTKIGDLDDYRAGYFDKVLTVLFRKKPQEMTLYINNSGHRLMESMMGHLYSHSIMQIAQRLLIPRRPSPMMEEQEQQQQQEQQEQPQDEEEDIISAGGNNNEQAPEMISGGGDGGDEIVAGENGGDDDDGGGVIMCDWSESPEILDILLDTLMAKQPGNIKVGTTPNTIDEEQLLDLSLNASEVLITIIQNSMLSSPTMLSLTSSETILRIINAATDCSGENENNCFSPHESLLTSAMNVLESLILQLGGYGAVGTMSLLPEEELALQRQEEEDMAQRQRDAQMAMEQQEQEMMENESNNAIMDDDGQQQQQSLDDEDAEEEDDVALAAALSAASKALIGTEGTNSVPDNNGEGEDDDEEPLIADLSSMLEHLPLLLERLSYLLRHPSTKQWTSPMQFSQTVPQQMLGNSRLRIVRVLESLVLLGDPDIDSKLVQSNCLEICLDFFWEFQWCSMLHQSVANLLVHVFEGQNTRFEMQEYFLVKCNLLGRLMDSFVDDDPTHHIHGSAGNDLAPASSGARIEDVVTNLQDVTMSKEGVSSVESEKGSSSDDPLPVSEDDVDAAMETENKDDLGGLAAEGSGVSSPNIEQISTEAVRFESRDVSTVGDINAAPPSQTFRYGYMGHVIIICQALVHAYTNDPQEHDMEVEEEEGAEITSGAAKENGYVTEEGEVVTCESGDAGGADPSNEEGPVAEAEPVCPKDDFGEPLLLFEIVHTHALAERWHEFVDTTLSTETAVQSTPLGGFSMQMPGMDPMHSHRPGLADEGYMMGDDGEGPPAPPRGMLGGGDAIDMDENDLDVAASMMAGLSLGRTVAGEDDDSNSGSINSGDSERSYNSGETASERSGYAFDDPLGKTGGLGIELGKLTQYKAGSAAPGGSAGSKGDDDDDGSHSSSDEEPESQQTSDTDVPVMDLFAGNFDYGQENVSEETPASGFADFANFDAAPTNDGADDFGPFTSSDESEEIQKKSSDIDEIFGAGDHADLLASDEPQETNKTSDIDDIFGTGDHADLLVNDEPQDTDKSANIDETLGAGDKADLVEKNKVAVVEPVNPFDDAEVGTEAAENAAAASGEGVGTDAYMTSLIEAAGKVQSTEDTSPPDGLDVVVSAPSDELMADAIARVENKKETSKDGQVVDIA